MPAAPPELVVSIVIPMFNEADVIPLLVERLRPVADGLDMPYEVVAVDDGSSDATPVVLQRVRRDWPELRVVRLRTNAGHQAAISAGLERARGGYVVTLDADLQDPPEVIPKMLAAAHKDGVDVVYGVRSDRSSDSWFKRSTARAFYRLMSSISRARAPEDAGDYRLMSRATVEAVNALPEGSRVLRLIVPSLGFPASTVTYRREARAAGSSKYPLSTMIRLSVDAITGFSLAPLRLAIWAGLIGGIAAFGLLAYALIANLSGQTTPGWTSTVVIVSFMGALQLIVIGILGEYVGRVYAALQARPSYFIAYDSATGAGPELPPPGDAPER